MGWSSEFLELLRSGYAPLEYRLEFLYNPAGVSRSSTWRSIQAGPTPAAIGVGRTSSAGSSVVPGEWSSTQGAWSIQLVGESARSAIDIAKGSLAVVYAGLKDWAPGRWQAVALGILNNMSGLPPNLTMEFWSLFAGLQARRTTEQGVLALGVPAEFDLFFDVGVETLLSGTYSPGSTTLNVVDETAFEKETGAPGILKITPSTGAAPFYLLWTAKTTGQLTVSAAAQLRTTARAAPTGSVVRHCAYLNDPPTTILRKILASTGNGTNGSYDTYPDSWGFAIPDELFDHDDIDRWENLVIVKSDGVKYSWDVVVEEPVSGGIYWYIRLLLDAGIFPVVRQGQISARAAQDPREGGLAPNGPIVSALKITEGELQLLGWSKYDPNQPTTAGHVSVLPNDSALKEYRSAPAIVLPSVEEMEHDVSDRVYAFETLVAEGMLLQLARWGYYPHQVLQLRLPPRFRQLVEGDLSDLTTERTWEPYDARRVMVLSVDDPGWGGGSCDITVAIQPESEVSGT
jgi:hypothetical protein